MGRPDIFDLQRRYQSSFPVGCGNRYEMEHVWLTTELSSRGDAKEQAEVKIIPLADGQCTFVWRLPYETQEHAPTAIEVKVDGLTETFEAEDNQQTGEGVKTIKVELGNLRRGESRTIHIA